MAILRDILKPVVAAFLVTVAISPPLAAEEAVIDGLLDQLSQPDLKGWKGVEEQVLEEWSRSGSPSMDLLLERGRAALQEDDAYAAIEHLTALTDHAPGFAEGWNARATAWFRLGRYGLALSDIEVALALNPNHFGALTGLGIILEELGREEKALEAFRAAAAIHPNKPDIETAIERLDTRLGGRTL